jgi:stage III sporulation protein AD
LGLSCEFSASLCKEAGEDGLAKKIEFSTKIILLSLAMPVLIAVLEMIKQWIAL